MFEKRVEMGAGCTRWEQLPSGQAADNLRATRREYALLYEFRLIP